MSETPPADPILRALRPVGPEPGARPALAISNAERRRRETRTKAQRAATGESPQTGEGKPRTPKKGHLTTTEAKQMAADVARLNHGVAASATESASNRRFAAVALGVAIDKHLALDSRAPLKVAVETDESRAAGLALARRLFQLDAGKTPKRP